MKKDKMIKNTCGAISLMLALLVVPFYAVAGILVEASRYQSALTGLDDAMNTSALSVLSDYDSFLQSRFGLLAMAQNDDPSVDNGYTGNKDLEEVLKHRETIVSQLKDCGFDYVTLDLEGFCSGSMDKKIAK